MSDAENPPAADATNSLPPASPTTAQPESSSSSAPAPPSLLDNPILLAAATGKKFTKNQFQKGNPFHRPTVMTIEMMAKVLTGLRTTKTVSGAIALAGIGRTTYYRHRNENAEFSELAEIAEAHATSLLVVKLIEACGENKRDWRGFAWLLERRCSSRREFAKFNPDAITHDVLATAISKVVAVVLPKIAEADRPAVLQAMEAVFADLKPKEKGEGEGE